MKTQLLTAAALLAAISANAAFTVKDDGKTVLVSEDGVPVIRYCNGMVTPPDAVPADQHDRYRRAGYFHPLYDLDGNVISQDFPGDHFHHRGVFWAWPESTAGTRKADVWALDGFRPHGESVEIGETTDDHVVLHCVNRWSFDDTPDVAVIREYAAVTIHQAEADKRAIDFALRLENVTTEPFALRGSTAKISNSDLTPKGYGGFSYRPHADHKPMAFTAKCGPVTEDVLELDSPWVDVSFSPNQDGKLAGVTMVQHPGNPGYPHRGWILRHYAFLGASWPHRVPHALAPGESVTLRYRLVVHRGSAEAADVAAAAESYANTSR